MEFIDRANILADAWMYRRDDAELLDFFIFNDLGPALAFGVANGLILDMSEEGQEYVEQSYKNLLSSYGVEDIEYETLQDILEA
jgi:hypothetical protein